MADEALTRLSAEEAKAKAIECRAMAMRAKNVSHQIMLAHIADTWERIAASMVDGR